VVWPQARRRTPMNPKGDDRHFPLGSSSTAEERPATLQGARKLSRRPGRPYRTAPSKGARSRIDNGEQSLLRAPQRSSAVSNRSIDLTKRPLAIFFVQGIPCADKGIASLLACDLSFLEVRDDLGRFRL